MSEIWIEGTVKAISKKDGKGIGILVSTSSGEKWYNESNRKTGVFQEPNKGERVKMLVNEGVWITQLIPAKDDPPEPDHGEETWTFKDKDHSIAKQVCLKAAVEFYGMREQSTPDTVVEAAEQFWKWMKGEEE